MSELGRNCTSDKKKASSNLIFEILKLRLHSEKTMLHTILLCIHLLVVIQCRSDAVEKVIHNVESVSLQKHSSTRFHKNYPFFTTNHVMKSSKNLLIENTPHFPPHLLSQLNRTVSQQKLDVSMMNACPTWMYRINDNSTCQCGSDLNGIVKCNKIFNTVSVLDEQLQLGKICCLSCYPLYIKLFRGHLLQN